MNINQLKYVLEIAGSSSMREASTKLYVSQPALSASIRELEEELGILIFEITNKGTQTSHTETASKASLHLNKSHQKKPILL